MRVHEDHEQIFDDAMDQKATVSKEVSFYTRIFLKCMPMRLPREGVEGAGKTHKGLKLDKQQSDDVAI